MSVNVQSERFIRGLRLYDDAGNQLLDKSFCSSNYEGDWITKKIPEHHRIIGIYVTGTKSDDFITRLGFAIWKPNPRALDE